MDNKAELEKTEQRVIEVNEWFTPFTDYDGLPYDTFPDGKPYRGFPDTFRSKTLKFQLANVGEYKVSLWWDQATTVDEAEDFENYLLVLPASEKIVNGPDLKAEQEKMETRPMVLEVEFLDEDLQNKTLQYMLEAELPSGQLISAEFRPIGDDDELYKRPQAKNHWMIINQEFNAPLVPEVSNIIGRIKLRFVPKD